ncbi:MAG: hypothetical protein EOP47_07975 [Sphingobacteriaceae bacterium]|nr:MAG: hypothetical protein EOP47_07975 [Sphingobacteriaceae bacterium]
MQIYLRTFAALKIHLIKMKKCILAFALLFTCCRAIAYNPIYQWSLITREYSYLNNAVDMATQLPGNNNVTDVVEDNNGTIWIAVDHGGLRSFDGKKLKDPKCPKDCFAAAGDILSLECDSKNNLWIGTTLGLVKYDGTNWTNIDESQTGIRAITDIAVTATDKIYVTGLQKSGDIFKAAGAAFYNGQNWAVYNTGNSNIPDTTLSDLTIDNNGALWAVVGNNNMGAVKFDGKSWKVYNAASEINTDNVYAIATNKTGKLWFATPKGIMQNDGSKWNMMGYTNAFSPKLLDVASKNDGTINALSLCVGNNGDIWLGTQQNGAVYLKDRNIRIVTQENSPLLQNSVRKIMIDKDGRKWFVTGAKNTGWARYYPKNKQSMENNYYVGGSGITIFKEYTKIDDAKWTVYDNTNSELKLGSTYSIGEDKEGGILMPNTGDGLVVLKNGKFNIYKHNSEMQSSFSKMFMAPDNKVYLEATIGGVKVFENGKISDFAKNPNIGGVNGMAYDKDNAFWVSGTGGISKYNNGEWETFDKKHGDLPTVIFYTVFKDSKGTLWAGSAKGLMKYDGTAWQVISKKEVEFPSDDITVITESKDGKIWLGTKSGISIFDGSTWSHISKIESPKVSKPMVNDISFDSKGNTYIATEGDGLLRYDGSSWTQFDRKNTGTLFDKVTAVKAASNGKVYIATETSQFNDTDFTLPSQSPQAVIETNVKAKIKLSEPKQVFAVIEM